MSHRKSGAETRCHRSRVISSVCPPLPLTPSPSHARRDGSSRARLGAIESPWTAGAQRARHDSGTFRCQLACTSVLSKEEMRKCSTCGCGFFSGFVRTMPPPAGSFGEAGTER
eukprot:4142287-Pleurochrysis_carterae.AAC.1